MNAALRGEAFTEEDDPFDGMSPAEIEVRALSLSGRCGVVGRCEDRHVFAGADRTRGAQRRCIRRLGPWCVDAPLFHCRFALPQAELR